MTHLCMHRHPTTVVPFKWQYIILYITVYVFNVLVLW
jgi:hypothetical protein